MFSTSRKADAAPSDESLDNWPIPHEPEKPWPEVCCFESNQSRFKLSNQRNRILFNTNQLRYTLVQGWRTREGAD